MEPSGHYWKPLAAYLRAAGIKVVTVNPHHVKKAKEFDDNSPTKSDRKDAWVIARRAGDANLCPLRCVVRWACARNARQSQARCVDQVDDPPVGAAAPSFNSCV